MGGVPRQEESYVRNENRCTAKHIMKHQNTEDKKKTSKEKENILDKGTRIRMPLNCSTAIRQQWSKAFKILKENYFQSTLLYPAKL